jgi:hypothetical protein
VSAELLCKSKLPKLKEMLQMLSVYTDTLSVLFKQVGVNKENFYVISKALCYMAII